MSTNADLNVINENIQLLFTEIRELKRMLPTSSTPTSADKSVSSTASSVWDRATALTMSREILDINLITLISRFPTLSNIKSLISLPTLTEIQFESLEEQLQDLNCKRPVRTSGTKGEPAKPCRKELSNFLKYLISKLFNLRYQKTFFYYIIFKLCSLFDIFLVIHAQQGSGKLGLRS